MCQLEDAGCLRHRSRFTSDPNPAAAATVTHPCLSSTTGKTVAVTEEVAGAIVGAPAAVGRAVVGAAGRAVEQVEDAADAAVGAVKDSVQSVADKVTDTAESAVDSVNEAVSNLPNPLVFACLRYQRCCNLSELHAQHTTGGACACAVGCMLMQIMPTPAGCRSVHVCSPSSCI